MECGHLRLFTPHAVHHGVVNSDYAEMRGKQYHQVLSRQGNAPYSENPF